MTIDEFKRLDEVEQLRIAAYVLADQQGGQMLITSGMLHRVRHGAIVSFDPCPGFDRILFLRAKP